MKKELFDYIIEKMKQNRDIYFISAGLGWPRTEELSKEFPFRYIQTEAAEQTALDIAVGLAYAGKIPFVYTITPFFLRGYETLRTYINHENLNVKLVGAGRDDDYSKHDGFSHEAGDVPHLLAMLRTIKMYFPESIDSMKQMVDTMISQQGPDFISIKK